MSNQPEAGSVEIVVRRRPSRRHRRNRRIRRFLLVLACASMAFVFASIALQHLTPSLFRASRTPEPSREAVEASRRLLLMAQQESLRQIENRPVYPYSVVPGGVRDAKELKLVSERDPVVRAHYAGFDYQHARVVRLLLARAAYVSYRIGNQVYYTKHRVMLKKGENIITDGKIIVRSRCGNRVEEMPQQLNSALEPPAVNFDEPRMPALGTAMLHPPVPFESALLNPPPAMGPALPLSVYDPFVGGSWTPITPPPLPAVCGIEKKPTTTTGTGKKKKVNPCGNGSPSQVPEPGTWLLVASGLGTMCWMYWKRRRILVRA